MTHHASVVLLERHRRVARHDHVVRRFSRDLGLLRTLDRVLVLEPDVTRALVSTVCGDFGVALPDLLFRSNRRPDTGLCDPPRRRLTARFGEDRVLAAEAGGRIRTFPHGRLRLGTRTLAGTVAHELGHHVVNHTSGWRTPGHGKAWVAAYDAVAQRLAAHPALLPALAAADRTLPTLAP